MTTLGKRPACWLYRIDAMRVFILGATGSIGSAITEELLAHDHMVSALARSEIAENKLHHLGVKTIRGDLREPCAWVHCLHDVDAIVHVAATFTDDMGEVDRHLVQTIIDESSRTVRPIRFIYTGGTWLYGETGDSVATEDTAFNPLPSFAWMVENGQRILNASNLDGMILHPAMVYHRNGGVLDRFLTSGAEKGCIEVWGSCDTHWPVVHQRDLAVAYRLALENGLPSESYNVSAESGVRVGDIVDVLQQRMRLHTPPKIRPGAEVVAEQGDWAAGPVLNQRMSGSKAMRDLGWQPTITDILAHIR